MTHKFAKLKFNHSNGEAIKSNCVGTIGLEHIFGIFFGFNLLASVTLVMFNFYELSKVEIQFKFAQFSKSQGKYFSENLRSSHHGGSHHGKEDEDEVRVRFLSFF